MDGYPVCRDFLDALLCQGGNRLAEALFAVIEMICEGRSVVRATQMPKCRSFGAVPVSYGVQKFTKTPPGGMQEQIAHEGAVEARTGHVGCARWGSHVRRRPFGGGHWNYPDSSVANDLFDHGGSGEVVVGGSNLSILFEGHDEVLIRVAGTI
jgi:hypothetical protein